MIGQPGNVVRLNRVTVRNCDKESTADAFSICRDGLGERDEHGRSDTGQESGTR